MYTFFELQGELTITADMEALADALFLDSVPEGWARLAYPSLHGLAQWYQDLLLRIKELEVIYCQQSLSVNVIPLS